MQPAVVHRQRHGFGSRPGAVERARQTEALSVDPGDIEGMLAITYKKP